MPIQAKTGLEWANPPLRVSGVGFIGWRLTADKIEILRSP
jgi:hypothetical protein